METLSARSQTRDLFFVVRSSYVFCMSHVSLRIADNHRATYSNDNNVQLTGENYCNLRHESNATPYAKSGQYIYRRRVKKQHVIDVKALSVFKSISTAAVQFLNPK